MWSITGLLPVQSMLPVQSTKGYFNTSVVVSPDEPAKEPEPKAKSNTKPPVKLASTM